MWQFRSAPGEWTIHDLLVHLADSEAHGFVRLRKAVAEPGGSVHAWDQEVWPVALNYHDEDPDLAVLLFESFRASSSALYRRLRPEDWRKTIHHPENGVMTVDDILGTMPTTPTNTSTRCGRCTRLGERETPTSRRPRH